MCYLLCRKNPENTIKGMTKGTAISIGPALDGVKSDIN